MKTLFIAVLSAAILLPATLAAESKKEAELRHQLAISQAQLNAALQEKKTLKAQTDKLVAIAHEQTAKTEEIKKAVPSRTDRMFELALPTIPAIVGTLLGILNRKKLQKIQVNINGRLSQLLNAHGEANRLKGNLEGRDQLPAVQLIAKIEAEEPLELPIDLAAKNGK